MREDQRRIRARPFPDGQIEAVNIDDAQFGVFLGGSQAHASILACGSRRAKTRRGNMVAKRATC
jgi:hypothetical protein